MAGRPWWYEKDLMDPEKRCYMYFDSSIRKRNWYIRSPDPLKGSKGILYEQAHERPPAKGWRSRDGGRDLVPELQLHGDVF